MSSVEEFKIPDEWGLSEQQEVIIGSLIDERGKYIPPSDFCNALYIDDKPYAKGAPAPAKLRVLMLRCREIVKQLTEGRAKIDTMRRKGWRITKKARVILMQASGD